MAKTHAAITGQASALVKYQDLIVGKRGVLPLLYFEFCAWLGPIPGALGLALRAFFWKRLFASCGRGVLFGKDIILRQPGRIRLGEHTVIGEGCILDARHPGRDDAIVLGHDAMLSNNVMISCKGGAIHVGANVGINAQAILQSTSGCEVHIEDDCVIGQAALIIGGGGYDIGDTDSGLIRTMPMASDGGVAIESNVWIGAKAVVLGGVRVETGAVVGAGAVVTRSIPARAVCVGAPARVIKTRKPGQC